MSCVINEPQHYMLFPDMEAQHVIRKTLTLPEFVGYCKGNSLKYRLRAGKKNDASEDLAKAAVYERWLWELYNEGDKE